MLTDYHSLDWIRNGSLPIRRWSKRLNVLFISTNLWLDQIIDRILSASKETVSLTSEKITSISDYQINLLGSNHDVGQNISTLFNLDRFQEHLVSTVKWIDIFAYILLFLSLIFWFKILVSIAFIYSDYRISFWESGKRQYFILVALVINLVLYVYLHSLNW